MQVSSPWKTFHIRPEDECEVGDFYDSGEVQRYSQSNAMRRIQRDLTLRALDLARFPLNSKILDAGCGSGFSLEILKEVGYKKIYGFDLLPAFVAEAKKRGFKNVKVGDLRQFPFSAAEKFDGIISISALQWVSVHGEKEVEKVAVEFFSHLITGGSAVVQFYPKSEGELMSVAKVFRAIGFKVKMITENPGNARKRKSFLLLYKEF